VVEELDEGTGVAAVDEAASGERRWTWVREEDVAAAAITDRAPRSPRLRRLQGLVPRATKKTRPKLSMSFHVVI